MTLLVQREKHQCVVLKVLTFTFHKFLYGVLFLDSSMVEQMNADFAEKTRIAEENFANHLSVEKEYEESMTDSAMNVSW